MNGFETEKQYQERVEKIIANGEKEYERIVLNENYIIAPVFSEEPNTDVTYDIINYRKEYI